MKMSGFQTFEVGFCASHRCCGKLGVKAPPVAIAAPTMSMTIKRLVSRTREMLSAHGSLALKLSVVLWTELVLAAVFLIAQA
ncbi:hypothetical protein [Mesorhizobium sp. M0040]|uniref:hypothetical protein n=1 Tax=Mesorhizobium sp. M0040 TaxID=2956855 RepID=UPI00333BDF06